MLSCMHGPCPPQSIDQRLPRDGLHNAAHNGLVAWVMKQTDLGLNLTTQRTLQSCEGALSRAEEQHRPTCHGVRIVQPQDGTRENAGCSGLSASNARLKGLAKQELSAMHSPCVPAVGEMVIERHEPGSMNSMARPALFVLGRPSPTECVNRSNRIGFAATSHHLHDERDHLLMK